MFFSDALQTILPEPWSLGEGEMSKRKQSGIDVVATMPWPMGIALGLLAYLAIRHGIGWYFGSLNNPYLSGLGKLAATGIYSTLGWVLLVGCWIAASLSF
jgi:restriction system protein